MVRCMGCMQSVATSGFPKKDNTSPASTARIHPEHSPRRVLLAAKIFTSRPLTVDFRDGDNREFYEESDFVMETLRLHNKHRARHGAPALSLDEDLCHMAQMWANLLAHTNNYVYRNAPGIGENIYCRCPFLYGDEEDVTGEEVVQYWYRDHERYNDNLQDEVLHVNASSFTQMVWKSSKHFGIGKARARDGKYMVVAYYRPSGNTHGNFHLNVSPDTEPEDITAQSHDDGNEEDVDDFQSVTSSPRQSL